MKNVALLVTRSMDMFIFLSGILIGFGFSFGFVFVKTEKPVEKIVEKIVVQKVYGLPEGVTMEGICAGLYGAQAERFLTEARQRSDTWELGYQAGRAK